MLDPDMTIKLRELRRERGLRQRDVARLSGLGVKTISSFETGERIESMKLSQLRRILAVYGMSEQEFFEWAEDSIRRDWSAATERDTERALSEGLHQLPAPVRRALMERFRLMIRTARSTHRIDLSIPHLHESDAGDWNLLTSRN